MYRLVNRRERFANKFFSDYQPLTFKCLEEWHAARESREVRTRRIDLNMTFYESLDVRKNHVREGRVEVRDEEWIKNASKLLIYSYPVEEVELGEEEVREEDSEREEKNLESSQIGALLQKQIVSSKVRYPARSYRVYQPLSRNRRIRSSRVYRHRL